MISYEVLSLGITRVRDKASDGTPRILYMQKPSLGEGQ